MPLEGARVKGHVGQECQQSCSHVHLVYACHSRKDNPSLGMTVREDFNIIIAFEIGKWKFKKKNQTLNFVQFNHLKNLRIRKGSRLLNIPCLQSSSACP